MRQCYAQIWATVICWFLFFTIAEYKRVLKKKNSHEEFARENTPVEASYLAYIAIFNVQKTTMLKREIEEREREGKAREHEKQARYHR